ncbi:hypothetical protein MMC11_001804 [Xylographa trunciseda]|nr:hypothetical protein [Xylographa trunciseda]
MISQWSRLPVTYRLPLLVKHNISSSAYTIQITDLTRIWTESLDRRQIIRRAFDENASIDPSEGPGQLMKLLQEIEKALKGQANTSLTIEHSTQSENITLRATVVLPNPFPLLTWCFHLSSAPQELLTSDLLLPCLSELLSAESEVASLLTHIKDKDHVISRLTEKLEAAGIEMTAVFPSAAPPRRSKANARELVLASVRGLSEFNIKSWRSGLRDPSAYTNIEVLCSEVFKTGSSVFYDETIVPQDDHKRGEVGERSSMMQRIVTIPSSQPLRGCNDAVEDFQNTPVREIDAAIQPESTGEGSRHVASDTHISGSDTSDDDLDGPVSKTHEIAEPMPIRISEGPRKLGALGGRKLQGPTAPPQTALGPSDTAESEPLARTVGKLGDKITPLSKTDKTRPKLGRIGGLHREEKVIERKAEAQKPTHSADTTVKSLPIVADSERSRRQSLKKSVSPPPARETSQERADRNRARLKRELEEKNKIPVKKKRKF